MTFFLKVRGKKKKEKRGYDEVRRNRAQYMEKNFGHSVALWMQ
jgi:hypothetical protein